MTQKEREDYGALLREEGRANCCQAVVESLTIDSPTTTDAERNLLRRAASGFRTGMGGMEATCGALCGAVIAAGLSDGSPRTGIRSRQMHKRFQQLAGATICKELKAIQPDGRPLCECSDCVRYAIRAFIETDNQS